MLQVIHSHVLTLQWLGGVQELHSCHDKVDLSGLWC